MDALAREFSADAHFLFIYTREAHPDSYPDYPAHKSLQQKCEQAKAMQRRQQTPRTILIDSLEGDVHRAWSGLSNASWVIDHTGRVTYKAAWTSARHVREALQYSLATREFKRQEGRIAFYQESVEWTMPVRATLPPPVIQ